MVVRMAKAAQTAQPKVLYRKTVDRVSGVLSDVVERASRAGNVYLELVFEDGTFIQMPLGFRIAFDLVQGAEYTASWEDGKFSIVQGLDSEVTADDAMPF
jgi:hypothetical protein